MLNDVAVRAAERRPPAPGPVSVDGRDVRFPLMLRTPDVLARASVSGSHWWRLEQAGQCPVRLQLGARARGLPEEALDHWLAHCLDLRSRMVKLTDPIVLPLWSPDIEVSAHPPGIVMLTLAEVERFVGVKKTFIYNRIGEHVFPRPAPVGTHVRRWALHEVAAAIEARNAALRDLRRPDAPWVVRRPGSAVPF